MAQQTQPLLGKYREIVLAVGFFLVFDLAVLILNFYTSYQIAGDAVSINLAGRQRMLSQRMTKALLTLEADSTQGRPTETARAELKKTVGLFDGTLGGFRTGGAVVGGDEQPVALNAVKTDRGRQILNDAYAIWAPYLQVVEPVLASPGVEPEKLAAAVQYARANNLKLLGLMNDLTTDLEQEASAKAEQLRLVQTLGILLALLNFAFILFKFIRKLQESDRQIERAHKETQEILTTVKEGLFLLDSQRRLGSQFSRSLQSVLRREIVAGAEFFPILQQMVPAATFDAARDHIDLLFGNRVKEGLVASLNPLSEVEVKVVDDLGGSRSHYLAFQFNRVIADQQITHLLVTVQDVTERVNLTAQLAEAKGQAKIELDILLRLLSTDQAVLGRFLGTMEQSLKHINSQFKSAADTGGEDHRHIVNQAFRAIHALKGESAALGLEMFETLAHEFEKELVNVREKKVIEGDDLVKLTVRLNDFFERYTMVKDIIDRIAHTGQPGVDASVAAQFLDSMHKLADRIATSQEKRVQISAELAALDKLPEDVSAKVRNIAFQMLRNAITHGIEPPQERTSAAKPAGGTVFIACKEIGGGQFEFVLRDDGRGLVPERLRSAMVKSGRYSEAAVRALDDQQVVMKIFEPGFSTATRVDTDAGHGMGMDVVREKFRAIGGHLHLTSRPNQFTEFTVRFAADSPTRVPAPEPA